MTTTTHLGLPLPSAAGSLEEDVVRIIDAFRLIDDKINAIDALMSSDDISLDTVQEIVAAIRSAQEGIGSITGMVDARFSDLVDGYNMRLQLIDDAIASKAGSSHSHSITEIDGLDAALLGKQANLASGVNIKTINGQSVVGSGNLQIAVGSMMFIGELIANDSASVMFGNLPSGEYDELIIIATNVKGTNGTSGVVGSFLQNGSWKTSGYIGNHLNLTNGWASVSSAFGFKLQEIQSGDGGFNECSFSLHLIAPSDSSTYKTAYWTGCASGWNVSMVMGYASSNDLNPVSGIRFLMSSGNIASGVFRLYGIRKN